MSSVVAVVWTEWRVYQCVICCSCSELWCGQSGGCISVWNLDSTKGSLQRLQHPLPKDQAKSTTCDVVFIVTCPRDNSSVWSYIYPGGSSSSFPVVFPVSAGFAFTPNCFPQSGMVQSFPCVNTLQTMISYLGKICHILYLSGRCWLVINTCNYFRIDSHPLLAHQDRPPVSETICNWPHLVSDQVFLNLHMGAVLPQLTSYSVHIILSLYLSYFYSADLFSSIHPPWSVIRNAFIQILQEDGRVC